MLKNNYFLYSDFLNYLLCGNQITIISRHIWKKKYYLEDVLI